MFLVSGYFAVLFPTSADGGATTSSPDKGPWRMLWDKHAWGWKGNQPTSTVNFSVNSNSIWGFTDTICTINPLSFPPPASWLPWRERLCSNAHFPQWHSASLCLGPETIEPRGLEQKCLRLWVPNKSYLYLVLMDVLAQQWKTNNTFVLCLVRFLLVREGAPPPPPV